MEEKGYVEKILKYKPKFRNTSKEMDRLILVFHSTLFILHANTTLKSYWWEENTVSYIRICWHFLKNNLKKVKLSLCLT